MRGALHVCIAASLLAAAPAATATSAGSEAPAGGTFAASTAGAPVGAAVGGWSDDTDGSAGDLTVDFASAPVPAGTSVEAIWTSKLMRLAESDAARKLASFAAADYLHNPVTDTVTDVQLDARVSVNGSWSAWQGMSGQSWSSRRTGSGFQYLSTSVSVPSTCSCDYQVQVRIRASKDGVDASRLEARTAAHD